MLSAKLGYSSSHREEADSVQYRCQKQVEETGRSRVAPVPGSVGACNPKKRPRHWLELRRSPVMRWG